MNKTLNLSLGIPLKDSASYLADLFCSLEDQTYLPKEIIFADDRSTDNSLELVNKFSKYHSDWNIHICTNEKRLGIAGNYNRIVRLSSSKWVQILDADDYLYGEYFSILGPYLNKDYIAIITGLRSNSVFLNLPNIVLGRLIPSNLPNWLPVLGGLATRSGVIYRRSHLIRFGFIDPVFDGSDILHLIDLQMLGGCAYVGKAKIFYRVHSKSQTATVANNFRYFSLLKQIDNISRLYYLDYYLRKKIFRFIRTHRFIR